MTINAFYTAWAVLCCQLANITIGPLKFWELCALCLLPIVGKVRKQYLLTFSIFVLVIFVESLVVSTKIDLVFSSHYGLLKTKYIITLVRAIELILCLYLVNVFISKGIKKDPKFIVNFLNYNTFFLIFILGIYVLEKALGDVGIVTHGEFRLKGFFVEGGPFGLYIAFLFILSIHFKSRFTTRGNLRLWIVSQLVFVLCLLLSQSKAGYVFAFGGLMVLFSVSIKQFKNYFDVGSLKFIVGAILVCGLLAFVVVQVGKNYINDYKNLAEEIKERPDDANLVMGRIAGMYIGTNIIKEYSLFGVGLGNYSLVRNDPKVAGIFPPTELWDLSGLGGVFNLLIENGVFGLCFFIWATMKFFKRDNLKAKDRTIYLFLFTCPFLLGAQLYLFYPWVVTGLLFMKKKNVAS